MARRDLMYDSRYPMPWIVWRQTYSVTVPAYQFKTFNFAHGLPFRPLIIGQWSTNSNFSPSYDLSVEVPGGATGGQVPTSMIVSADATNINITADNNMENSRTFYLRLMAFAPPEYKGNVTPVDYTSPFRFNTKYRYQKLYMAGISNAPTINHNLGYLPQAKIWNIVNDTVSVGTATLTTSSLTSDSATNSFYYHIYLDPME